MTEIIMGTVLGSIIGSLVVLNFIDNRITSVCKNKTEWVIEESLIKKTLTCTVEIKEKK